MPCGLAGAFQNRENRPTRYAPGAHQHGRYAALPPLDDYTPGTADGATGTARNADEDRLAVG